MLIYIDIILFIQDFQRCMILYCYLNFLSFVKQVYYLKLSVSCGILVHIVLSSTILINVNK